MASERSPDIFNPDAPPCLQAVSRLVDAAQEARIAFELIIKSVFLGPEAYQHPGRFAVTGDNYLPAFGFAQKAREVVLDFGERNPPHAASPNFLSHAYAANAISKCTARP